MLVEACKNVLEPSLNVGRHSDSSGLPIPCFESIQESHVLRISLKQYRDGACDSAKAAYQPTKSTDLLLEIRIAAR